ncbi:MAG: glycosyltransferase 87 family protein [Gaiellaceae bacterium]
MTSLQSSPRRADTNRALLAAAFALVVFVGAWVMLHHGYFARGQIVDTPVYEKYGALMAHGEVPYRDFSLEYPPGALPVFVLPAFGHEGDLAAYNRTFGALIWMCGAATLVALAVALTALGAGRARLYGALALAAVAPLLLGSVVLTRFDLWPTALAAWALAALVSGRVRLGHGLLGAGVAVKVWPAVLIPVAFAHVWRTRGRHEAFACLGVAAGVVAVVVLPFFVLAPGGFWNSVVRQTTRPLQIESLGAALLIAAHHVSGTSAHMVSSHGSQNLGGTAANVVGALQSLAQIAALAAIWIVFARRRRSDEELVLASAGSVVAFVALGKVLSPQFLIWLIPLVPLVRSRIAWALFAFALVWTQAYFPQHYWDYALRFATTQSWLVLLRDLALVALLILLVIPLRSVRVDESLPTFDT